MFIHIMQSEVKNPEAYVAHYHEFSKESIYY